MRLVDVPNDLIESNATYKDLLTWFLKSSQGQKLSRALPLGLYRFPDNSAGGITKLLPYVFTNPDCDTKLEIGDKMYVITQPSCPADSAAALKALF